MDRPDLVPDLDVLMCRRSSGDDYRTLGEWRWFWGVVLDRPLSHDEAVEILLKIIGMVPLQWEDSWARLELVVPNHRPLRI